MSSRIKLQHHVTTVVRSVQRETEGISRYELADPDDWELPPFAAGAHITLYLPNGMARPYSLCGSPRVRNRYWIAVQRQEQGRGGSLEIHRRLQVGSIVPVSLPSNDFSLARAASGHLLIAGGIGITAVLSMAEELASAGDQFRMHFTARSAAEMAFRDYIRRSHWAARVQLYFSGEPGGQRLNIDTILSGLQPGEHVYCCGPASMLDAFTQASRSLSPEITHVERFAGLTSPSGPHFTVALAKSGIDVPVAPGESIVEALRRAGVEIGTSCEAGVCGTCKVRYLSGLPEHRDLVLSSTQRQRYMLPCVSRCIGERLVIDL